VSVRTSTINGEMAIFLTVSKHVTVSMGTSTINGEMAIFLTVRGHVTVSVRTSTINGEKFISLCVFFFSNLPHFWNKNDFFSRTRKTDPNFFLIAFNHEQI